MDGNEKKLPLKIIRKSSTFFAKETGFSGPQITNFFAEYGDHITDYWDMELRQSRWVIFENCLESFPYNMQTRILKDLCEIDETMCRYGLPEPSKLEQFKKEIMSVSLNLVESVSAVKIDFDYVRQQVEKSRDKIQNEDYDGAVTNARSLLETILIEILRENDLEYERGDLIQMYNVVAKVLKLSPSEYQNKSLKQILSGCFSITHGLAEYRNEASDAHGKDKYKYSRAEAHHARFYVNVAQSLSDFLIDVWEKQKSKHEHD